MERDKLFLKCKAVRDLCLKNAEDLVVSAKLLIDRNLQHIQYHLSALALEEIGKAELLEMSLVADINQRDTTYEKSGMEDHVRKLYWAFWGPSFGKKIITKKEVEELQGLANSVHLTRLSTLYVNPSDTIEPKNRLSQSEANEITSLAEARLEMEKGKSMLDPDDPSINKEELKWFLESATDPEKFKLIFGSKSQEKLIEIGNVRDWIHWLKVQFDQNDIEIKKLIDGEIGREKPGKEEAKKLKYKIKIRINSESHAIRSKELNKWNQNSNFIKLFSDNKQDLIFEILLTKAVHINGTWSVGWGIARAFVAALNISTNGFFWWNIPRDRSRFYENMWDVELNTKMGVEQRPALAVNFKDLHWVLKEPDLARASMIFYYITRSKDKKEGSPLNDYVTGLSFLAKNDIHLRLELNAFSQFYLSLKNAFLVSKDWDGKTDFTKSVLTQFSTFGKHDDMENYLRWGEELQISPTHTPSKEITLTEVYGMKQIAELYFLILSKRYVDSHKKKVPQNQTHGTT